MYTFIITASALNSVQKIKFQLSLHPTGTKHMLFLQKKNKQKQTDNQH